LQWIDPMAWVIKQFQDLLYWGEPFSLASAIFVPVAALGLFAAGLVIFQRATVGLAKFI
jgi:ABC-type polysaccharide/polyol phosphate export permease